MNDQNKNTVFRPPEDMYRHPAWLARREQVLQRDGYRCRYCGSSEGLQVHHRQYHSNALTGEAVPIWNYPGHLLVTLCRDCHQRGHSLYKVPVFRVNESQNGQLKENDFLTFKTFQL